MDNTLAHNTEIIDIIRYFENNFGEINLRKKLILGLLRVKEVFCNIFYSRQVKFELFLTYISHGKNYTFSLKNTKKSIFSNENLVVKIFEFFSSES